MLATHRCSKVIHKYTYVLFTCVELNQNTSIAQSHSRVLGQFEWTAALFVSSFNCFAPLHKLVRPCGRLGTAPWILLGAP